MGTSAERRGKRD
jgi:hypothetical protein